MTQETEIIKHPVKSDEFWEVLRKLIPNLPTNIVKCTIQLNLGSPTYIILEKRVGAPLYLCNTEEIYEIMNK